MDMLTPAGIAGISLHLFGLPLLLLGGALVAGAVAAWVCTARAAAGRARLGSSWKPSLLGGLLVATGLLGAKLMATQAGLGSMNGLLDWMLFIGPAVLAGLGVFLTVWPVLALLRPSPGGMPDARQAPG